MPDTDLAVVAVLVGGSPVEGFGPVVDTAEAGSPVAEADPGEADTPVVGIALAGGIVPVAADTGLVAAIAAEAAAGRLEAAALAADLGSGPVPAPKILPRQPTRKLPPVSKLFSVVAFFVLLTALSMGQVPHLFIRRTRGKAGYALATLCALKLF
jgi:hypothetical protein